MMRKTLLFVSLLLAGCSQKAPEAFEAAGPEVGVSSAPGIAVNYRYGFRLPIERIAATQEDHAAQCEALGPVACRVTGMTYHVGRNRTVAASLQLRLAPDRARQFGKQAIETVARHGGMLVDARIDSEEAGQAQAAAIRANAANDQEKGQISTQLGKPGLAAAERTNLQQRLAFLNDSSRQSAAVAHESALKLAETPVTFDYESGDVDLSLSDGPVLGAVKDGWGNIVAGFATILLIVITLLPWAAFAGLAGWGVHRLNRLWTKPAQGDPTDAP
jgi:hypothetical protein